MTSWFLPRKKRSVVSNKLCSACYHFTCQASSVSSDWAQAFTCSVEGYRCPVVAMFATAGGPLAFLQRWQSPRSAALSTATLVTQNVPQGMLTSWRMSIWRSFLSSASLMEITPKIVIARTRNTLMSTGSLSNWETSGGTNRCSD